MQVEQRITTPKPVKEITAEDIRAIPGYENIGEEQADKMVDGLKQFCHTIYQLIHRPDKAK